MQFASLGSGSGGNATVVRVGSTTLLIDCGFSGTQLRKRLAALAMTVDEIDAVLVTHEHGDHIGGVPRLAQQLGIDPWMTWGTWQALESSAAAGGNGWQEFSCHQPFAVGDAWIEPFPVPHDAREPSQFVVSDGARRLGILTDAGHATPLMHERLAGCQGLLLEFNHDREMLQRGSYPWSVIQRIDGDYGHLNNAQSAALLDSVWHGGLQHVVIGHVSERNNHQRLIDQSLYGTAAGVSECLTVAGQDAPTPWMTIV